MAPAPRVPPGQRVTKKFPRLDLGRIPKFDPKTWELAVDGEVENPLRLTWQEFSRLPLVEDVSDFHCVTQWTRLENLWEGVPFRTIAEMAAPKEAARFVTAESGEGYTTELPLGVLMDDDVLLAVRLDGEPLSPEHGGPVRLVVPKRYGWKSAKWLRRLTFTREEELGYWEVRGYHKDADPWKEQRFSPRTP